MTEGETESDASDVASAACSRGAPRGFELAIVPRPSVDAVSAGSVFGEGDADARAEQTLAVLDDKRKNSSH